MPPPSLSTRARQNLLKEAQSIAEYYWRLGYRGPLSADSVIDRDDTVHLTEVNAQLTSSTHLHSTIYARLGGADRSVCQLTSPSDWHIRGVAQFLAVVDASGCSYDPATRRGVVAVTPKIGGEHEGHLILAVIYEMPSQLEETLSRLNQAFSAYANAASTPEGHPLSYST